MISLGATCVLMFVIYAQWCAGWERLNDFEALCDAEDSIRAYIDKSHKWPRDWESLTPALASRGSDVTYARDRVDVNFAIDLKSEPRADEWYLRVKSGVIPGEERNANDRLRNTVSFYSEVRRRTTNGTVK